MTLTFTCDLDMVNIHTKHRWLFECLSREYLVTFGVHMLSMLHPGTYISDMVWACSVCYILVLTYQTRCEHAQCVTSWYLQFSDIWDTVWACSVCYILVLTVFWHIGHGVRMRGLISSRYSSTSGSSLCNRVTWRNKYLTQQNKPLNYICIAFNCTII